MRFFVRIIRKLICLQFAFLMINFRKLVCLQFAFLTINFRKFANVNDRSICSKTIKYYFYLLHVFLTYRNQKLNDIFIKSSRLKLNRFSYWELNNQILYKIHFCFIYTRRNQRRQQFYHFSIIFYQKYIIISISIDWQYVE